MHSPSQLTLRAASLVAIIAGGALLSRIAEFWWLSAIVVIGGGCLLAWIAIRFAQDTARARLGSDELRRLNESLEAQVEDRTSDSRDSNARLRSIIESAVDGILVIDEHGRIEAFNPGAERLFGYPESEVLGRNVSMLMPSPYHEEHDGYLQRYLTTGTAKIIGIGREVTGRRRDGSLFPLHLSVGEMAVAGGRKFTGMLHDLSARVALEHRLRASEARWRAVIQSAVDGIVVIDEHGRIESFNPAAERLFGYTEQEVVGKQRPPADAVAVPRGTRQLPRTIPGDRPREDHRRRPRGDRPPQGRHDFPLHLSVGELPVEGERRVHRHPARPDGARPHRGATPRTSVAGQGWRDGGSHRPRGQEPAGRGTWRDPGDSVAACPRTAPDVSDRPGHRDAHRRARSL